MTEVQDPATTEALDEAPKGNGVASNGNEIQGKHIIVVHGYLLSGTGSNIYSCNLAHQWKKQGHSITIFCQDPRAKTYEWVDEFVGPKDPLPKERVARGKARVIVPDIDGLLPVYVYDDYEGYTVKTIPNCTDEEIERHIELTSKAIREAVDLWGCDKVLANHALLSPVNVKRALEGTDVPFDIKIHGSGILFVLAPHPVYKKYAIEAIEKCNKIIAGTNHIVRQVKETFEAESEELKLDDKLVIVPPGLDPDVFTPCRNIFKNINKFLDTIRKHIAKENDGRDAKKINFPKVGYKSTNIHTQLVNIGKTYNQRVCDSDLPDKFPNITKEEPIIMYFGKFLNTKGVAEILLCFPEILKKFPTARLVFIGFGGFREHLQAMIHALGTGNLELFRAAAQSPDENGKTFLQSTIDVKKHFPYRLDAQELSRITVTGCLNHTELGLILPLADIVVVSSKANEAFGMVAVEAMAAGVLPLCVYHSGLVDVLDEVKKADPELESKMHLETNPGGDFEAADGEHFTEIFPEKVNEALEFLYPEALGGMNNDKNSNKIKKRLRKLAEERWAWDGICKSLANL
ncbi:unnamed protein product [Owenia fusiformis]|uniref:Uncharacterized protein n=1 Tax=Owenia fusiformis TaxID=6347 RepID=A0A8J1XUQ2_OWEFU|nr:unnamed protein product [Owenia fusiformis]